MNPWLKAPQPAPWQQIALSLLFFATWAPARDWPQWRGPLRNGISTETGLLKEWPKDGPKLLWQTKENGSGYSTPAVAGERLYLLGNDGLDNEFVQALTVRDGKRIWRTRLGKVGNPDQDPKFPAARSTPTVDGELLYALSSDFSPKLPTAIGGAVKVGDFLYGATGQALLCVEFTTGNVKWEDRAVGPAALCYANGRLYLHGENGDVALIEASSDAYRERGRFTPPDQPKHANEMEKAWAYPVVANGRLYLRDHGSLWCYDVKAAR